MAAFKQSDLFLFPSQIECSPIVLFEAMAAGLPFLSSDAGNAAEISQWSNHAGQIIPTLTKINNRIEVDVNEGAQMLSIMLNDPAVLKVSSHNGKEAWKNKFTWKKIALQYEELYQSLCNNK